MIKIQDVSFSYKNTKQTVLSGVNLTIADGEFLCVIGHSGCGKSTLIRLLAGLEQPDVGTISIDDAPLTRPGTDRAVVFQQYSLFPWQTVYQNVLFATRKTGRFSREEARERTEFFLNKAGIWECAKKYPCQLSGGMRQRTAIARALSMDARTLLLDEPFGALDVQNRTALQKLLHSLWKEEKKTIVFVTHDLDEALNLGNRIVFLRDGQVDRECRLSERIHCCCVNAEGLDDCKSLRQTLEEWYQ